MTTYPIRTDTRVTAPYGSVSTEGVMKQNRQPQNPLMARALELQADVARFEGRW